MSCHPRHDIQLGHFPQGKGATTLTEENGYTMRRSLEDINFCAMLLSLHTLNFGGGNIHLGMARYGAAGRDSPFLASDDADWDALQKTNC